MAAWNSVLAPPLSVKRGKTMATEPKRVRLTPGSELAKLLDAAGDRPVVLETNGGLYRLDRMEREPEDIWSEYDPTAALEGINAAAGSWQDLDPEEVKAFVSRGRVEGTRPAERP